MINNLYLVCSKSLYKNEIFNIKSHHNRDNCLYHYYLFKEKLKEKGISIDTFDYFDKNKNEEYALVFFDFPRNFDVFLKDHPHSKKFLLVYESPIKVPQSQNTGNFKYFEKVFTWNTKLVNNINIFRLSYAQKIDVPHTGASKKQKLLAMIAGHKLQTSKIELYSQRIEAIRWFEKNHPNDFDLYGEGWNEHYFKDSLYQLNRVKFLKKLFKPNFPSYKGMVKDKKTVYENYKFALCYENAEYPDYITEKILDCLIAGIVPIYLGAPNIANYVPKEAFIDKRKFKTYENLYSFIKNMPKEEYIKYVEAIKNYVESDKIYPFSAQYFAKTLSEEISKSIL